MPRRGLRNGSSGQGLLRPPTTRLLSTRADDAGDATARSERGKLRGFTLAEAAGRVTALLKNIGLVKAERFARVVVVLGHGSTSPHESLPRAMEGPTPPLLVLAGLLERGDRRLRDAVSLDGNVVDERSAR